MEIRHIRYFLAVAQEMNFTKAAERLLIAQPPLSRQIRDLEDELGTPLFIREPHKLRLTEEGELFKQYAQQILDLSEKSKEEVRLLHEGLHGTLYLGMVEGNAPYLVSEWIAGFHRLHPRVQYDLWNGNSDDVTMRIRRGLCELALIIAPYNTEELEGIPVYDEPWVAIMSKDHPFASLPGNKITPQQLVQCDLLMPSRQSRMEEITGWFAGLGTAPHVVCRMANTVNAFELAEQNVGVAIFPASQGNISKLGFKGERENVCVREIDHPSIRARYVLVRAKNRTRTRVAGEFIGFVREQLKAGHITEKE